MSDYQLISRKDAKARGLSFFFTGKSCKRGHVSVRRVSCGVCLDCARINDATWKAANPEKAKAWKDAWTVANADRVRKWHAENYRAKADEIKSRVSARYASNAAEVRTYVAEWRRLNPEKVRAYSAAWTAKNRPFYREATARRRAGLKTATPAWLTSEQLAQMRGIYANVPDGYHVDHIVPLNGKNVCGLHVPWNLQHLPKIDNLKKSSKHI